MASVDEDAIGYLEKSLEVDADFIQQPEYLCTKCGDLYLKDNGDLLFNCTECSIMFQTVETFKKHILNHYEDAFQPNDFDEYVLEEEALCDYDDDDIENKYECESAMSSAQHNEIDKPLFETKPVIQKTSWNIEIAKDEPDDSEYNQQESVAFISDSNCSMEIDNSDLEEVDLKASSPQVGVESNTNNRRLKPPFVCKICKKQFNYLGGLRLHEKIHTRRERFLCEMCDMSYFNKKNLIIHQRVHTGEKPYACELCSERFITSTARNKHQNEHTGHKPYSCKDCEARFSTSMQLLNHCRIKHLDLRRFECSECKKKFRTTTHLKAHYDSVHADLPRNHKCVICGAAFKTKPSLQAHMKAHQEKQYKCNICGKFFARYSGIHAHLKRHFKRGEGSEMTDIKTQYQIIHSEDNFYK